MLRTNSMYRAKSRLKPRLINCSAGILFCMPCVAAQGFDEVEFNDAFMRFNVDVSRYSQGNPVDAGTYRADIYLNNRWIGRQDVRFALATPLSRVAVPCLDMSLLEYAGVSTDNLPEDTLNALQSDGVCAPLSEIIGAGEATYDSGAQRIDFNVPQAKLIRRARGYVSPKHWDNGITAASLKYDYTGYRSEHSTSNTQTYHYLSLLGGLNWEAWRLRYRSTLNRNNDGGIHYQNIATYLERAIPDLRSKLTLGEATTDGQVFDSISYRGVALTSDDRMYADSLRGYAPVVRGVANSNARVVVTQMGQAIYETTVPPGPFVIDDLYPTGQGGDLYVTVTEADGTKNSFTVPFASIAELLRPGMTRYTLMAGEYRDRSMHNAPPVIMGTLRHGFSNAVTGYSGLVAAEGYAAAAMGLAFNTSVGALAMDITQAQTRLPEIGEKQGQSIRMTYARNLQTTNTNLTLATWRYSTQGYFSPVEAIRTRDSLKHAYSGNRAPLPGEALNEGSYSDVQYANRLQQRRNRAQLSVTQGLPDGYGSFYASANMQDYWDKQRRDTDFQLGYNNHYKSVSYNISANRMRNVSTGKWDNQFGLSFSIPLGSARNSPQLSSSYSKSGDSDSVQTGISGSLGEESQYQYGTYISSNRTDGYGRDNTFSVNANWQAPHATIGANYSKSRDFSQYGASLSGGVVAYRDGLVLSPTLGETIAIVEARDAAGAHVVNYAGLRLNGSGRAVVPNLNPYRLNVIDLDPKGLSTDTELKNTSQRTAPTAGSIALVTFETSSGYSILLNGKRRNGNPLPFGASVKEADGGNAGYIAQGGQAIVRVTKEKGALKVVWGTGPDESCQINYTLTQTALPAKGEYRRLEATCQ